MIKYNNKVNNKYIRKRNKFLLIISNSIYICKYVTIIKLPKRLLYLIKEYILIRILINKIVYKKIKDMSIR